MYSFSSAYLSTHVEEVLELAESDTILITLDSSDNLVLLKESVWRSLQDTLHLLATPINAERLQHSLQQLRTEYLVEGNVK